MFNRAFRGYERQSVDEYAARLHQMLLDAQEQADNASHITAAAVGDKVTEILTTSLEVGDQTVHKAQAKATRLLEQAKTQAAEARRSAEEKAADVLTQAEALLQEAKRVRAGVLTEARAEAERDVADARQQLEAVRRDIDDLTARKSSVLGELERLQRYLAGAGSGSEQGDGGDADGADVGIPITAAPDLPPPAPAAVGHNGHRSAS